MVLDFTHVLAGPRRSRTLAEYGAEVLHISSPFYADSLAQHLGVDVGESTRPTLTCGTTRTWRPCGSWLRRLTWSHPPIVQQ